MMQLLGEWSYSGRTFKAATGLFWTAAALVLFAFSTSLWLVSVPSEELPDPKFTNMGELARRSSLLLPDFEGCF